MKRYLLIMALILSHIYTYNLYNKNKYLQENLTYTRTLLDSANELAFDDCKQMIKYERSTSFTNGCYNLLENLCSGRKSCINNYKHQCVYLEL